MNIYFACSITGGREFESAHHEISTSHLVESDVQENERAIIPQELYERDINWIKSCNVLIAEVSLPSHGVGYEIGFALNIGKPVLCLHQLDRRVSKMISGNTDPVLTVKPYSLANEAISLARTFLLAHKYS